MQASWVSCAVGKPVSTPQNEQIMGPPTRVCVFVASSGVAQGCNFSTSRNTERKPSASGVMW